MYFETAGPANSQKTAELAVQTAKERSIRHIVAASNTGKTASLLTGISKHDGIEIVCVTHAYGYAENGKNQMADSTREELTGQGVCVVTATHVLSGVERGISAQSGGMYPAEIVSNALRMFGQGVKVCVEIAIMALDAGRVPYGEEIIAVGGTGRGADTAVVVTPAHASQVFQTKIHEILCKPR